MSAIDRALHGSGVQHHVGALGAKKQSRPGRLYWRSLDSQLRRGRLFCSTSKRSRSVPRPPEPSATSRPQGAVIRPTFYSCRDGPFVAGQFRDSGLVSWMRAAAHGVTALGLASGCGSGERDEHRTGIEGGRGRRRSWREPHPDCHSTVALQRAVWVDTFLRAVWTRFRERLAAR